MMMKHGVMSLTIGRVCTGTQQAVSFHWRNAVEDETGMIKMCAMSSATKMHTVGSKTDVKSESALNRSSVKKGTMTTMVPIIINLTGSILPKGVQCIRSQGLFPRLEEGVLAHEPQTVGDREV
jgi:hypothetical protein